MGEEIILNGPEQHKMNKLGANVDVRNFWIRHAQKMSGEVASSDKTTISLSLISEKGVIMSKNYGETITPKKHGAKSYVSKSDRTKQTAENILIGYQKNNPGVPIRPIKINEKLLFDMPKDFLRLSSIPFGKFIIKWKCSSQMAKRNDILDFNTTSFDSRTGMPYTTDDEKLFEKYMKKHKTDVLIDCMGDFYTRMGDNWVEISHTKLHKYKDYLLKMNDYKNYKH